MIEDGSTLRPWYLENTNKFLFKKITISEKFQQILCWRQVYKSLVRVTKSFMNMF